MGSEESKQRNRNLMNKGPGKCCPCKNKDKGPILSSGPVSDLGSSLVTDQLASKEEKKSIDVIPEEESKISESEISKPSLRPSNAASLKKPSRYQSATADKAPAIMMSYNDARLCLEVWSIARERIEFIPGVVARYAHKAQGRQLESPRSRRIYQVVELTLSSLDTFGFMYRRFDAVEIVKVRPDIQPSNVNRGSESDSRNVAKVVTDVNPAPIGVEDTETYESADKVRNSLNRRGSAFVGDSGLEKWQLLTRRIGEALAKKNLPVEVYTEMYEAILEETLELFPESSNISEPWKRMTKSFRLEMEYGAKKPGGDSQSASINANTRPSRRFKSGLIDAAVVGDAQSDAVNKSYRPKDRK